MTHVRFGKPLALLLLIGSAACGDSTGPLDSSPITLTINSMNPSDIEGGLIEKDENISTETGNPWGIFIKSAEDRCGASPVAFEVTSAKLAVDIGGSSNVEVLEDVISGSATVFFRSTQGSDASAVTVDVASSSIISGAGPVDLTVTATRASLNALYERIVGGDFHVGMRAQTNRTANDDFSLDALVTFEARAHCE